jgi:hypothetical protein
MAAFVTLIHMTPMVSTFGHSTQEGHLFFAWASGPEVSPSWVRDRLGERPPYASVEGHTRMGMLTSQWL